MSVFIENRPGRPPMWIAQVRKDGKNYRRRFPTKAQARQWESKIKWGWSPEEEAAATLKQAVDLCKREHWQASRDPRLGRRIEEVLEFFGTDCLLSSITGATLQRFVNALKARPGRKGSLSAGTINRYLAVISAVFDHARRRGSIDGYPAIPWQEERGRRFEWLTESQENALVQALPGKHGIIVRVLCSTGLRPSELWGLKPSQVEYDWIRLWETKNGRPRSVPVDPVLSKALRAMIVLKTLPTYREHYREFKRACAILGLPTDVTVYTMRHTTATRLAAQVPGPVVQRFMGHSTYSTTERYIHLSDEELRKAAEKIKPTIRVVEAEVC